MRTSTLPSLAEALMLRTDFARGRGISSATATGSTISRTGSATGSLMGAEIGSETGSTLVTEGVSTIGVTAGSTSIEGAEEADSIGMAEAGMVTTTAFSMAITSGLSGSANR